ncbi:MAG TPA: hypothetical protein VKX17_12495 [Planctomycetota bacterium]|nr:hypothetical protein [Planctomycetota bacterium]
MSTATLEPAKVRTQPAQFDARAALDAFERDWNSGQFDGREGQWAAYVDAKLVKVGPYRQRLFDFIHAKFPNALVALQPISVYCAWTARWRRALRECPN